MKHYQPLGIYVAGGELRCFIEISAYLLHVFRERCLQNSTVQCFIGNRHNAHSLHTSPYNNTAGRVFFHPRKDLRRVGGRLPEGRAPISVQTSRLAFVRATYLPAGVGGNEAETPGPKY